KTVKESYFRELEALPMYASIEDAEAQRLRGVIETGQRSWWVDCIPRLENPESRHVQYVIWDAAMNWLARMAPDLESRLRLPEDNLIVELDVRDLSSWMNHEINVSKGPAAEVAVHGTTINVRLFASFFDLLRRPENDGESELLRAIARGVSLWSQNSIS